MKNHLIKTWEKVASKVFIFFIPDLAGWHRGDWLNIREKEGKRLLKYIDYLTSASEIDLIFCIGSDDFFTPALCIHLKQYNVPMVNYNVDSDTQWYRCIKSAKFFDLLCLAYKDHLEVLSKYTNTIHLPMAANCDVYKHLNVEKQYDILFVGSYTIERERVLSAICEITPNIIVFGAGWEPNKPHKIKRTRFPIEKYINDFYLYLLIRLRVEGIHKIIKRRKIQTLRNFKPYSGHIGGYLQDENFVRTINQAKIVIGINQRYGVIGELEGFVSCRLRDFEVPACGACYLVQRYDELSSYFEEDVEVASWSTISELQQKVIYYLFNDEARISMGMRARERVLEDHTWDKRFAMIIQNLKGV